ncbi:hypothetical protein, partial [Methylobacterium sp. GC_Met_1]|uniref:hypothetical protein n=1 Tax=Methylobacterium sp. GC_Met_1 TaxID=2937377 RepID=UPI00226A0494
DVFEAMRVRVPGLPLRAIYQSMPRVISGKDICSLSIKKRLNLFLFLNIFLNGKFYLETIVMVIRSCSD